MKRKKIRRKGKVKRRDPLERQKRSNLNECGRWGNATHGEEWGQVAAGGVGKSPRIRGGAFLADWAREKGIGPSKNRLDLEIGVTKDILCGGQEFKLLKTIAGKKTARSRIRIYSSPRPILHTPSRINVSRVCQENVILQSSATRKETVSSFI